MASSLTPTQTPRRATSLPAKRTTPSSPDPQLEILFTLPSVRIVSFTASSKSSSSPGSSSGSAATVEDEPGSLSCVSRLERVIAIGPLRIYRAPGSVAFLNCVNALRPILPKSQAWCIDDKRIVLQIRPPQYWRIEISDATGEGDRLEELKKVFEQVLLFDKTACPFKRDIVVELPVRQRTIKKPWRPVERPRSGDSPGSSSPAYAVALEDHASFPVSESRPSTPCPAPKLSSSIRRPTSSSTPRTPAMDPESGERSEVVDEGASTGTSISRSIESEDAIKNLPSDPVAIGDLEPTLGSSDPDPTFESFAGKKDDGSNMGLRRNVHAQFPSSVDSESEMDSRPQSTRGLSRAFTTPPALSVMISPMPKSRTQSPLRTSTSFESASSDCSSSAESFHSTESWHSPLAPPSPPISEPNSPILTCPYPHKNLILPKRSLHTRGPSELTVVPAESRVWDMTASSARYKSRSLSPPPRTPPNLVHDGSEKSDDEKSEIATPPTVRPSIRHRATTSSNSRRRELSPLPAAVNLFSPPRPQLRRKQRHLRTSRHLPTAIIQKTCEILLSPPSHLFQLMISIASKIAAGEWRGVLPGHGEVVHWDFEDEYGSKPLLEDNYGTPLVKSVPAKPKTAGIDVTGGSWEVD